MKVKVDENEFDVDAVKASKTSKPAVIASIQTDDSDTTTADNSGDASTDTSSDPVEEPTDSVTES